MRRAALAGLGALLGCLVFAGCCHQKTPERSIARGAPPAYAEVATRFNERVGPLDRLWARTVVRASYRDKDGRRQRDQFEGHLQYLRPDRLLLTFDKVGNTYAALGANQRQYWWLQREPERKAFLGDHDRADPRKVAELGLPVHPLSFVDLLAITPLDPGAPGARVEWSADGRFLLATAPGRLNPRRLWLNPDDYTTTRVELLGTGGEVAITADLSRYQPIAVRGPAADPGWRPTVATALEATRQSDDLSIRMDLFEPEVSDRRPLARIFNFETVRGSLRIPEGAVVDLNNGAPGAAAPGAGDPAPRALAP
ncbi:MAG: hypothetical protein WD749_00670 [Phycisphaerales bacterium]